MQIACFRNVNSAPSVCVPTYLCYREVRLLRMNVGTAVLPAKMLSSLDRGQKTFSVKTQGVNILDFADHTFPVAATHRAVPA